MQAELAIEAWDSRGDYRGKGPVLVEVIAQRQTFVDRMHVLNKVGA